MLAREIVRLHVATPSSCARHATATPTKSAIAPIEGGAAQPAGTLASMLKSGAIDKAQIESALQTYIATSGAPTVTYDQLNATEKAIAQLQVDHAEVGGIKRINDAHYESLKASNNIHSDLDRRLHAYKSAKETVEGAA